MSGFRIIKRKKDDKYLVQEKQYRGDYDGRYLCWVDSTVRIPKKLNIVFCNIPYNSNIKAIFDEEGVAKDYILDRIKEKEITSDIVVFEV